MPTKEQIEQHNKRTEIMLYNMMQTPRRISLNELLDIANKGNIRKQIESL